MRRPWVNFSRERRKCNSNPGDVGGKAVSVQELLQRDGITASLREILAEVDYSVPRQVDGLNVNEVLATYYVLRSSKK